MTTLERLEEEIGLAVDAAHDVPFGEHSVGLSLDDARKVLAWINVRSALEDHRLQVVSVWPKGQWREINDRLERAEYGAFTALTTPSPATPEAP